MLAAPLRHPPLERAQRPAIDVARQVGRAGLPSHQMFKEGLRLQLRRPFQPLGRFGPDQPEWVAAGSPRMRLFEFLRPLAGLDIFSRRLRIDIRFHRGVRKHAAGIVFVHESLVLAIGDEHGPA